MNIDKIKPIPKKILELIRKRDEKDYPHPTTETRYYAYLTKNEGELVKITVAVKNYYTRWLHKQVAVHGVHSYDYCFIKDMCFTYCGGGYHVGWYSEGVKKCQKWYERGYWGYQSDHLFDPYAPVVNREYIAKFPEYKYSAYEQYTFCDILQYLRTYEKYPQAEYLVKLGLLDYAQKKSILEKAGKDKYFRRWLGRNKETFIKERIYVTSLLAAYNKSRDILGMQCYQEAKNALTSKANTYKSLKELFSDNVEQFCLYLEKQKAHVSSYEDYRIACAYLGLDFTQEKHRLPHDFKKWHDIRTDQYATQLAIENEKKKAELYEKFANVAEKYSRMQYDKNPYFSIIIPRTPAELIIEGQALSHCVGKMNYDQKFAREESLIFFIRKKDNLNEPFVTLEYSLITQRIQQCYGYGDKNPEKNVLNYAHEEWFPYAKRQVQKIMRAA